MSYGQCKNCEKHFSLEEYNAAQSTILCAIEAPKNMCFKCLSQIIKSQPDLLEACKAWMKVESEMRENNPCPDLALRAQYRKEAVKLTDAAIAKAKKE